MYWTRRKAHFFPVRLMEYDNEGMWFLWSARISDASTAIPMGWNNDKMNSKGINDRKKNKNEGRSKWKWRGTMGRWSGVFGNGVKDDWCAWWCSQCHTPIPPPILNHQKYTIKFMWYSLYANILLGVWAQCCTSTLSPNLAFFASLVSTWRRTRNSKYVSIPSIH